MDLVYVVRRSEVNEPLRYSLRSIEVHFPVGRVWIVGYKPSWVTGVEYLPTMQAGTKWQNSTSNMLTACLHDEIAESFVYMNDDFYVVEPVDEVEPLNRGTVDQVLEYYHYARGRYVAGMRRTREILTELGVDEPLSYELHLPMVIHREPMVEAIRLASEVADSLGALHKRTLYGNLAGVGGRSVEDVKIHGDRQPLPAGPYWSTSPQSFGGKTGKRLRQMFPDPSSFERRPRGR